MVLMSVQLVLDRPISEPELDVGFGDGALLQRDPVSH